MTLKYELFISLVSLSVAFAAGRYSVPRNSTTTSTQTDTQTTKHENVHQTEVITKLPTGAVTETITTDTTDQVQTNKESSSKSTSVAAPSSKINISALAGISIHQPGIPLYGISASKEFIGPITLGAFGLTNGIIGVSVGINF